MIMDKELYVVSAEYLNGNYVWHTERTFTDEDEAKRFARMLQDDSKSVRRIVLTHSYCHNIYKK